MLLRRVPLMLGILAISAFGQTPSVAKLSFEVASVRAAAPGSRPDASSRAGIVDPQSVTLRGTTLIDILRQAYDVDFDQISGPGWLYDEHYDIVAKAASGTTKEQSNIMLQNLLEERFKMIVHHVSKEFSAYELTIAKGGLKLKEAADPNAQAMKPGDVQRDSKPPAAGFPDLPAGRAGMGANMVRGVTYMTARSQAVSMLTMQLAAALGTTTGTGRYAMGRVVDHTGLTGKYDFTLEFAGFPGPNGIARAGGVDDDPAPDIFTALEKQLGLKLNKTTSAQDTIVIDHIEKIPTEN